MKQATFLCCTALLASGCMTIYENRNLPDIKVVHFSGDCDYVADETTQGFIDVAIERSDGSLVFEQTYDCALIEAIAKDIPRERLQLKAKLRSADSSVIIPYEVTEVDLRNGRSQEAYISLSDPCKVIVCEPEPPELPDRN